MRKRYACKRRTVVFSAAVMAVAGPLACIFSTPPEQPAEGPGSPGTVATDVRTTSVGEGAQQIFIYEPIDTELTSAPVVVFVHGYTGVNPIVYGGWIKHLVQRGNIVLYPVYQATLNEADTYTANALAAIQNAYATLRDGGHILPDDSKLAIVGHSLGGVIGMNLAAQTQTNGLPAVKALLAANAGDATSKFPSLPSIQMSYEQVPADMLFLGVVGTEDTVVGEDIVLQLYDALTQIPSENREVLELTTDRHGRPELDADHRAPLAVDADFDSGGPLALWPERFQYLLEDRTPPANTINAYDYYGYWKWFDALTDAAFYGTNREYALGNTTQQTSMGTWSDGEPVIPVKRTRP